MITEFWIEQGWGVSIDNATMEDISITIEEIKIMDLEHGSFWIGHVEEEYVLEIHKNLEVFFIYGENQDKSLKAEFANWDEALYYIKMYFAKDFLLLINEIELLSFSNKRM
jgi:hypothetical protein